MKVIKTFWKEEEGQDLIEYSLLLGFVALFSVAIYTSVTGNISTIWGNASSALVSAGTGGSGS
jgi:Flp pilus assembly pilin Flp